MARGTGSEFTFSREVRRSYGVTLTAFDTCIASAWGHILGADSENQFYGVENAQSMLMISMRRFSSFPRTGAAHWRQGADAGQIISQAADTDKFYRRYSREGTIGAFINMRHASRVARAAHGGG